MTKHPDKGKKGMECYRTACSHSPANWYNHSTKMWYCPECAYSINYMNESDAQRIYGHQLCTRDDDQITKNIMP